MRERRVVVTGIGAVTPIGNNVKSYWQGLSTGKNGIEHVKAFETEGFTSKIGAEIKDLDISADIDPKEAKRMDRFTHFGVIASNEAVADAGLADSNVDKTRVGVVIGSGIGGLIVLQNESKKLIERGPRRVSPFFIPMIIPDIVAGHVSIRYGFQGPNYASVSACASGAHALGLGLMHIERGDADVMVVGGAEGTVIDIGFAGFCSAKTLSLRNEDPAHASRPFDLNRDGFVMGEGAGILVLEELEHAKKRGATIYTEFAGIGFTGDAYHITAPHCDGDGAIRAMKLAIEDAELNPEDIDYINAHGTSTALNDKTETHAIKQVFGDYARNVPISSNKSMHGHLLGATGAVECIGSILAIQNGLIPATMNYETPDPECDLDYVPNTAREQVLNAVISNSFGFGGHNVCLCLKKFDG